MKHSFQNILLAIVFALMGVTMVFLGLGIVKTSMAVHNQPVMVISGLMFFSAGTLAFFRSTSVPGAEALPSTPWIEYFLLLPILLGFGVTFFWAGIAAGNVIVIFFGILTAAAMIWFAIVRWPGRRKRNDRP